MRPAIEFRDVTVTYPEAPVPALRNATFAVEEGELCLVTGPTGAGKSTVLRAACALVPHFTGGVLRGQVVVEGRDTREHLPRDLADVVGVVGQDPGAGFVTDTVEEELAYAMEQLGVAPATMRTRVEEVLDLLGLAHLRERPLDRLSGGERQRVAIGAVLTPHPRVLVLDEPTSALDPGGAEEVLAALTRLVHDLGLTVLLAEHRLERVVQYADHVVAVAPDGAVTDGPPASMLASGGSAPPIVDLGRWAGWSPLPLSVRDARRRAAGLRARLSGTAGAVAPAPAPAPAVLEARDVHVHHGRVHRGRGTPGVHAVRGVDLLVREGEVVVLMGRNGSGKTSLLWALQGSGTRSSGSVAVTSAGVTTDPAGLSPTEARRSVALVPQDPDDLLFRTSVAEELAAAGTADEVRRAGTLLDRLAGPVARAANPRDLSEGQRLALALAVQLGAGAGLLLLDEPTRGLDYAAKRALAAVLAEHARAGGAVLLSTHDVEFAAECATRVVVLAGGEVVADGPAGDVLVASPTFAPQVARILHPVPLLTVRAVQGAVGEIA